MLQSEIIQRTPSIYFRFDDELHRGYSKSSFALDYSISNHKYIMSNKFTRDKSQHSSKAYGENINEPTSPYCDVKKYGNKNQQITTTMVKNNQYINSPLSYQRNTSSNSNFHPTIQHPRQHSSSQHQPQQQQVNRLQTEDFFQEFDTKYDITFERENDVLVNQWILQVQNEEGSKISRGNLFDEESMMFGRKSIMTPSNHNNNLQSSNNKEERISPSHMFQQLKNQQMINSNIINFSPTNNEMELSRHFSNNQHEQTRTNLQQHVHRRSMGNYSSVNDKENQQQNHFGEFDEAVSFGGNNPTKVRKYRQTNNWQFAVRDFENNSSLLEKTRPGLELKRKIPLKMIQNLIQKNSKERQSHQTRKKPIINADLFVSTINKTDKNLIRLSKNCPNSNPVISKKSSSLQSTFCYDNMFKTNAFRETLKSTTLENWRRKHHKKIENIVEKKTVSKKYRDTNIFDNLFIRG